MCSGGGTLRQADLARTVSAMWTRGQGKLRGIQKCRVPVAWEEWLQTGRGEKKRWRETKVLRGKASERWRDLLWRHYVLLWGHLVQQQVGYHPLLACQLGWMRCLWNLQPCSGSYSYHCNLEHFLGCPSMVMVGGCFTVPGARMQNSIHHLCFLFNYISFTLFLSCIPFWRRERFRHADFWPPAHCCLLCFAHSRHSQAVLHQGRHNPRGLLFLLLPQRSFCFFTEKTDKEANRTGKSKPCVREELYSSLWTDFFAQKVQGTCCSVRLWNSFSREETVILLHDIFFLNWTEWSTYIPLGTVLRGWRHK